MSSQNVIPDANIGALLSRVLVLEKQVRALSGMKAGGNLSVQHYGGIPMVSSPTLEKGFWAQITRVTGSGPYTYTVRRVKMNAQGYGGWLFADNNSLTAYNLADQNTTQYTALAVDSIVWVVRERYAAVGAGGSNLWIVSAGGEAVASGSTIDVVTTIGWNGTTLGYETYPAQVISLGVSGTSHVIDTPTECSSGT